MKIKAQASLEFLILTGFIMIAFITFLLVINTELQDETSQRENNAIKEIAWTIKNEVDLASKSIDGYSRNFTLPTKAYGTNYNAWINESLVFVESTDQQHSISLALPEVSGILLPGENKITRKNEILRLN